MSMICSLLAVTPAQIATIRQRPELTADFVFAAWDEGEGDLGAEALASLGPPPRPLELQKSWHIMHFLMTGDAGVSDHPGGALFLGEPLGDDVGYGPARVQTPGECRAFADFLASTDLAQLQGRLNYREMDRLGVYGLPMSSTDADDGLFEDQIRRELAWSFPALRDFVCEAADRGHGFLIWIS
jgi:hypothetical protein